MELIDGNQVASNIIDELKNKVATLETGKPCVAFYSRLGMILRLSHM